MISMVLMLIAAASFNSAAIADEVAVTIHGTVTDSTGRIVPGVLVMFIAGYDTVSAISNVDGYYELKLNDKSTGIQEDKPSSFVLSQNYPNPFNPTTIIPFTLGSPATVRLDIYSVSGQHVRTLVDGYIEAGVYTVMWDGIDDSGNGVSAGVYLYRLRAGAQESVRKMLLLDGHAADANTERGLHSVMKLASSSAAIRYTIQAVKSAGIPVQEGYAPPALLYQNTIDISFEIPSTECNISFTEKYESFRMFFDTDGILDQYVLTGDSLGIALIYYHEPLPDEGEVIITSQAGDREIIFVSGNGEYYKSLSYCGYTSIYSLDSRKGFIGTAAGPPVSGDGILQTLALSDTVKAQYASSLGDTTSADIPIFNSTETVTLWGRTYTHWGNRWWWLDEYHRWILATENQFHLTFNDSAEANTIHAFVENNHLTTGELRDRNMIIYIDLNEGFDFLVALQNNPIIKDGYYLEQVCLN